MKNKKLKETILVLLLIMTFFGFIWWIVNFILYFLGDYLGFARALYGLVPGITLMMFEKYLKQ